MNFKDYFTPEDFRLIKEHFELNTEPDPLQAHYYEPLKRFMDDLKLAPIESEHVTHFLGMWGKKDISQHFLLPLIQAVGEGLGGYDKFTQKITAGNFSHRDIDSKGPCFECAQQIMLTIDNWKPKLSVFERMPDQTLNYRSLVAPKPCLDKSIQTSEVTFDSGHLLVADWFRIEEFSEMVECREYSDDKSLNTAAGRIYQTKRYASEFNFICVSVGNSSPVIYQKDNQFSFGHTAPEGYQEVGYVCTDFWGVSVIDKMQLVSLLYKQFGSQSEVIVEDYIKEHDVTELHVTPGSYVFEFQPTGDEVHLRFAPNPTPQKVLTL